MSLAIDARMLAHSGIGTYVSNVLPRLAGLYGKRVSVIGDSTMLAGLLWTRQDNVAIVDCRSPIFSLREQLRLPRLIPPASLFWSPSSTSRSLIAAGCWSRSTTCCTSRCRAS